MKTREVVMVLLGKHPAEGEINTRLYIQTLQVHGIVIASEEMDTIIMALQLICKQCICYDYDLHQVEEVMLAVTKEPRRRNEKEIYDDLIMNTDLKKYLINEIIKILKVS